MSGTSIIILIILSFAIGIVVGFYIKNFISSPTSQKIVTIKHVLLYLVAMAQKELGGGTGALKLAKVYDEFSSKFPQLSKLISYDQFTLLVDEVLDELNSLISNNKNIDDLINNKEDDETNGN